MIKVRDEHEEHEENSHMWESRAIKLISAEVS